MQVVKTNQVKLSVFKYDARLHRSDRESLSASQARIEEPFDGFAGVVSELFEGA